jgi:hypothetical protein
VAIIVILVAFSAAATPWSEIIQESVKWLKASRLLEMKTY